MWGYRTPRCPPGRPRRHRIGTWRTTSRRGGWGRDGQHCWEHEAGSRTYVGGEGRGARARRSAQRAGGAGPPGRSDCGQRRRPVRSGGQQDRVRELQARHRPGRLGHQRCGGLLHPGLRHRHLGQHRPARRLQDRHRRVGVHHRHLPHGLLPGPRCAQDHLGDAERVAAADPAQLHHRRHDRALRLRQLGRLGVLERAVDGRLRRLHRPPQAQQRRREPHHLHRARRRQHVRHRLPDRRPDLAGLQHLRRLRLLRRRRQRPCLQGQLQPPVQHPRHRRRA